MDLGRRQSWPMSREQRMQRAIGLYDMEIADMRVEMTRRATRRSSVAVTSISVQTQLQPTRSIAVQTQLQPAELHYLRIAFAVIAICFGLAAIHCVGGHEDDVATSHFSSVDESFNYIGVDDLRPALKDIWHSLEDIEPRLDSGSRLDDIEPVLDMRAPALEERPSDLEVDSGYLGPGFDGIGMDTNENGHVEKHSSSSVQIANELAPIESDLDIEIASEFCFECSLVGSRRFGKGFSGFVFIVGCLLSISVNKFHGRLAKRVGVQLERATVDKGLQPLEETKFRNDHNAPVLVSDKTQPTTHKPEVQSGNGNLACFQAQHEKSVAIVKQRSSTTRTSETHDSHPLPQSRHSSASSQKSARKRKPASDFVWDESIACHICGQTDAPDANNDMGLCDSCNRAYHQKCHTPRVPSFGGLDDKWFCYDCTLKSTVKSESRCTAVGPRRSREFASASTKRHKRNEFFR